MNPPSRSPSPSFRIWWPKAAQVLKVKSTHLVINLVTPFYLTLQVVVSGLIKIISFSFTKNSGPNRTSHRTVPSTCSFVHTPLPLRDIHQDFWNWWYSYIEYYIEDFLHTILISGLSSVSPVVKIWELFKNRVSISAEDLAFIYNSGV